uniref:Large ribosomal subunit protein uL16c n=1 Tax=Dichotomosiphon tuberosus TaxID=118263 RepID=A0A386AWY3_9CHLO|nr:ribosomal protein L16 [Dichotomosiphon tuberosus]
MLQPKRTKFRKVHRGRLKGEKTKGTKIMFGDFALKALEPCWLSARQIESSRRVMTRYKKKGGQIWIRVFPDKPITLRPPETRMGSGKGNPEYWVAVVKPGQIIYEIKNIPEVIALKALKNASHKIPIKTKIINKYSI